MTDYYLGVPAHSLQWEHPPSVSVFPPVLAGGVTRTHERVGMRRRARFTWERLLDQDAARLKAFIHQQRNGANRFWAYDPGYQMRGSFPATEAFPNTAFDSTSGLTTSVETAASVADKIWRATRIAVTANQFAIIPSSSISGLSQYSPYVARFLLSVGRGAYASGFSAYENVQGIRLSSVQAAPVFLTGATVLPGTTAAPGVLDESSSGPLPGDYIQIPFASFSRCGLVDNGPNALVRSDEFPTTWAPTRSTVSSNVGSTAAPDGTMTADSINEDGSAATTHFVGQGATFASAAADYQWSCSLKAGTRSWACLAISESTSGHEARAFVNLSNGSLGTVTTTGANWSNARAFIVSEGNGWYRVTIVARKVSVATTVTAYMVIAEADNDITFSGLSAASIYVWRGSLAQSSVPVRGVQTVASATTGTSQTGSALYLKGLPASTNGLLLAGDEFEVITPTYSEMKTVTAPLNSDAAGLGYLQFDPPLRNSPADNAAVIVLKPMRRFLLENPGAAWSQLERFVQGPFSFTAVEDVAA